jgi:hypothetical protein
MNGQQLDMGFDNHDMDFQVIDLGNSFSDEGCANFARASAGYSDSVLLDMLSSVDGAFYIAPGNGMSQSVIGSKNSSWGELERAYKVLKGYGLKVRRFKNDRMLKVYGPKRGQRSGHYSC